MKDAVITFAILSASLTGQAQSSWQQLGPNGAAISALTNVPGYPDELYIVLDGFPARIAHTTDAGRTWSDIETIPDIISALAIDPTHPQTLYAAGKSAQVYRSTNAGQTWHLRATLPAGVWVRQLLVNPLNSSTVWAVGDAPAQDSVTLMAFVSSNGGQNWTPITLGKSFAAQGLLLFLDPAHPRRVFAGGTCGNQAKVCYSSDGGGNWHDISAGITGRTAYGLAVNPDDTTTLICATDQGIFHSTDEGASWHQRTTCPCYSVALAPSAPNRGLAGSENLVLRTTNYGYSWTADTTNFTGTISRWLAFNPASGLEAYAANSYGVFHTTDGGYTWSYLTSSFRSLTVPSLYFLPVTPETVYAAAWGYGFIKSSDRGQTWTRLRPFAGSARPVAICANPRQPDTMLAITSFDSKVWMTTDRGDSWVSYSLSGANFEGCGIAYHPIQPDTVYTWGGYRDSIGGPLRFAIYRSSDRGQTWTRLFTRGTSGICQGLAFASVPDTMFAWGAVDYQGVVLRSLDRGRTWTEISSGITGSPVRHVAFSPVNRATMFCATPAGVFRTDNGGTYWTDIGLDNVACVLPDTTNTNRLYAGTDTQGVFLTTDNGLFWQRDTINLSGRTVLFLVRHPASRSTLFCGTQGRSLFGRNITSVEEPPITRPALAPFSVRPTLITSTAFIHLAPDIGPTGTVELSSIAGRRLWQAPFSGPGQVTWVRPKGVAPGIYFLIIRSRNSRYVTKVIIGPQK